MDIILKQYVKGLGEKGDIVKVRDGYGRNYLIPQKLGIIATKEALKVHEENMRQAKHKIEHVKTEAQALANKIAGLELKVETLAGADGRLFGSITPLMIENQLKEQGIEVDRKRISLSGDIKELGKHTVTIDLHKEVKATLNFEVVAKAN